MSCAPITLFVYNRPEHTRQTLQALEKNELANESLLYVYADGPKNAATKEQIDKINEVRSIISQKWQFKSIEIIVRESNWGLADNIVDGVTQIINKHGRIIVLEDDIVTSVGFLKYMNDALSIYELEEKVMHISGYMFPVKNKLPTTFFIKPTSCWGWATWKHAWTCFEKNVEKQIQQLEDKNAWKDFTLNNAYPSFKEQLFLNREGKLNTWAIFWYASVFMKDGLSLHPSKSLVQNIGHDGTGENCNANNQFNWVSLATHLDVKKIKLKVNKQAENELIRFFNDADKMNKLDIRDKFHMFRNGGYKLYFLKIIILIKKITPSLIKQLYRYARYSEYRENHRKRNEFLKIGNEERYKVGVTDILGSPFKYVDSASFCFIYDELYNKEIYKFNSKNDKPYIIDAGANVGLSVLYFKKLYPSAQIVAFEPDANVAKVLKYNIQSFGLESVQVINKALWNHVTTLKFNEEGADGGRIAIEGDGNLVEISTVRLQEFLDRRVDLLKIDIEGAETTVLQDCKEHLNNVDRIFVEYHSFSNQSQTLHEILKILNDAGFRYNIQHVGVFSPNPFVHVYEHYGMDLQLNIFAYRL